jgi:hypothetical protein
MSGPWERYQTNQEPPKPWDRYAGTTAVAEPPDDRNFIQKSFDENTATSPKEPLLETGLKSVVGAVGSPFVHPIQTLNSMGNLINPDVSQNPILQMGKGIKEDYKAGGLPYAATKAAGSAFGNLALGTAASAAPEAINSAIPRSGRAGAALGNMPVNLSRTGRELYRAQLLSERGSTFPKAVNQLIDRYGTTSTPGLQRVMHPITYSEARDFYSKLSKLSSAEKTNMSPVEQRQLSIITKAFNQDIADTAEMAGKKAKYLAAMKEYRQAAQWKARAVALRRLAIKSLPFAAGATAYEVWRGR